MKKVITVIGLLALLIGVNVEVEADAQQRVRGYYRSNGSYVQPHYRSNSNYTRMDNWSTRGNTNPYTGQRGYKNPYSSSYSSSSRSYGSRSRSRGYGYGW